MCAPCFTFALRYDCHTLFSAVLIYRRVDPSSGLKKVKPVPSVKEEATARNEMKSRAKQKRRRGGGRGREGGGGREGEGGGGGVSTCYRHFIVPSKISDRLEQARILLSPRTVDPSP